MSILDAFDPNSKPLFTPEQLYGTKTKEHLAEICIVSFHHKVWERVLEEYRPAAAARAFTRPTARWSFICWSMAAGTCCFI